ncbi:hypothetical protein GCM10027341_50010 [Spirosoma knui]
MSKKTQLLFFTVWMIATVGFGQSKLNKHVTKQINDLVTNRLNDIAPGCAILIAQNGQIVYNKAFGHASLELQVPVRPTMVFRIGSITKQFTAVALLQLVEQGKIALTDSLQKFIKGYPKKGRVITIEHLLTQTSGIADYLNLESNVPNPFRIDFPTRQIVDSIRHQPLSFVPGAKFEYSNSNYFLIGYLIEQVSGLSYPDYLKQKIFDPIGLTHTYYEVPATIVPNRVQGYEKIENEYQNADFISMALFYSAGGLISTTEDLFRWNEAIRKGLLLKKETLKNVFRPYTLADGTLSDYGYGWFIRKLGGSQSIEHGGSIFGFRSEAIFLPQENVYVVGLFNGRQLNTDEQELCYDLTKLMLGKSAFAEMSLEAEIVNRYVGTYKNAQYRETLKIEKRSDGRLACTLSNGSGTNMVLSAQSETKFVIPQVRKVPTTIEFVVENGRAVKLIWKQENTGEFIRVEE